MANKKGESGLVYIKKNNSDNEKAPLFKGFISVPLELVSILAGLEPDSYGNVKLDIALWKNNEQPGVLKGNATLPYKKDDSKQARKPVAASEDEDF